MMAARNPVSVVNLVPYEKRLINRESHRTTKASVYIPFSGGVQHCFWMISHPADWMTVPSFDDILNPIYISVTMFNNEPTRHLLFFQKNYLLVQSKLIYDHLSHSVPFLYPLFQPYCFDCQSKIFLNVEVVCYHGME